MSSDPLLAALLGDAAALFPAARAAAAAPAPILRDREVVESESQGTPPTKLFSVVKLDRSAPGMCFGMIGVGSAFVLRLIARFRSIWSIRWLFR